MEEDSPQENQVIPGDTLLKHSPDSPKTLPVSADISTKKDKLILQGIRVEANVLEEPGLHKEIDPYQVLAEIGLSFPVQNVPVNRRKSVPAVSSHFYIDPEGEKYIYIIPSCHSLAMFQRGWNDNKPLIMAVQPCFSGCWCFFFEKKISHGALGTG